MEKYDLLECGLRRMFDRYSGHFQTRKGGIYRSISVFEAKLCTLISIWAVGSCVLAVLVDRMIAMPAVRRSGGLQRTSFAPLIEWSALWPFGNIIGGQRHQRQGRIGASCASTQLLSPPGELECDSVVRWARRRRPVKSIAYFEGEVPYCRAGGQPAT
jgi:hypothetical protein